MQRLQADWSAKYAVIAGGLVVEPASFAGGLVGRACSAYRRTGRSSERCLLADWSVQRAALAAELVSEAFSACIRTD